MPDEFLVCQTLFGPCQTPFRYGQGYRHEPEWLDRLLAQPDHRGHRLRLKSTWLTILAHTANTSNDKGIFDPQHPAFAALFGAESDSLEPTLSAYESVGALERVGAGWRVVEWEALYRSPLPPQSGRPES